MKKALTILTAILCIATTALQAQTDTLVTMKSNIRMVRFTAQWTPETATVKANGINVRISSLEAIYANTDGSVVITSDDNAVLTKLYCNSSGITELNVENSTALTDLWCYENILTELNVENNTALTTLECYTNRLTELNLENNTALTTLKAHNQQIKMPLSEEAISFPNPVKYKTSAGQQSVNIASAWYTYGGDVPKVGTAMEFTTNFPAGVGGDAFGGTITFVPVADTLVTMKSNSDRVGITVRWTPETATVTANGQSLTNGTSRSIPVNPDSEVIITTSDNAALTTLYCTTNQLTKLNVEKNTDLTDLRCYDNQLTELNVENNTDLIYLYCYNNQLTELNIENNTALITLQCYDNQLTELNVEGCTDLTDLRCYNNQLTELNVENNTDLISLYCYNNQLAELNVENNTALISLYCYNNQLAELNVENNTALTFLECNNNQLTELNVENNTALVNFYCHTNQLTELNVENNTALVNLSCETNQLTELNVENNTALENLYCNDNQLTELNVENNTALTRLYCNTNQLTELNVEKNTALRELYCYSNQLTELNVEKNTALRYLRCNDNQLTELNVENNTDLTSLYCHTNQLTELNVENNTALAYLWCYNNQLTELKMEKNPLVSMILFANNQRIEVSLFEGVASFVNPFYYKVRLEEDTVRIGTEWYLHGEEVPKTGATMEFTSKLASRMSGDPFGGTITFVTVFTVAFESNGGTAVESQVVKEENTLTPPANPTKSGHVFIAWYTDEDLTTAWDFQTNTVTEDITLYAKWAKLYTLTFESNGGTAIEPQTVREGNTLTPPANPTKSGYDFAAWYTNEDLTTAWNFQTDVVTEDLTLYAKWEEVLYAVTFESNGGTAVESQTVREGNRVTQPANPTKSGHLFEAWYTNANLTTAWNFETDVVTEDITLYAKWEINNVGINKVEVEQLSVYPNPTTGKLKMENGKLKMGEVKVFSATGRLVRTAYGSEINLAGLPNGVYLLQVGNTRVRVVKN